MTRRLCPYLRVQRPQGKPKFQIFPDQHRRCGEQGALRRVPAPPARDRPPKGSLSVKLSSLPPPFYGCPRPSRKVSEGPGILPLTGLPTRLSSSAPALWGTLLSILPAATPFSQRPVQDILLRSGSMTAPYTLATGHPFLAGPTPLPPFQQVPWLPPLCKMMSPPTSPSCGSAGVEVSTSRKPGKQKKAKNNS